MRTKTSSGAMVGEGAVCQRMIGMLDMELQDCLFCCILDLLCSHSFLFPFGSFAMEMFVLYHYMLEVYNNLLYRGSQVRIYLES